MKEIIKSQQIKTLVKKWGAKDIEGLPRNTTAFNKTLKHISTEAYNPGVQSIHSSHYQKDNHRIGIELEIYCEILFYRGLKQEHNMLLEVASRLK